MGIRETLNQNPAITTGVTAAVIVVALIIIGWQLLGGGNRPRIPTQAYYTVDDGETCFAADINLIPPFEHNGKEAVRVYLYTCGSRKEAFPVYLERYTPQAKAELERLNADPENADIGRIEELRMNGVQVKKARDPDGRWVPQADYNRSQEIMNPVCPEGSSGKTLEAVYP